MISVLSAMLLLLSFKQTDPNQKYLDYLSKSLVDHSGVRMEIKWAQIDGERAWSQIGVIELIGNKRFFLDTDQQSIKIDSNLIVTYYKAENGKIIYDTLIEGSYDIFDFLSGDFSGFTITNSTANRESIQLDYHMDAFNISGKIWIKQKLYEPMKFTFGNNPERPEQYIEVDITSYVPLHNSSLFDLFNPDAREIIDLRE
jgi:hypothetical protein|tara:strand:- start:1059 stop:1658 length:600 start_codon:yes stop_codon:yes gene_type:complete